MQTIILAILSVVIFVGVFFLVDAAVGIVRRSRGIDDEAVERRLSATAHALDRPSEAIEFLFQRTDNRFWFGALPFVEPIHRLIVQSGTKRTLEQLAYIMFAIAIAVAVAAIFLLPAYLAVLAIPIGLAAGIGPVLFFLSKARAKRVAQFEEQLPDAIDLIVRSLKVGHPLSAAIGVVGREMPMPVGTEFTRAADQASYGRPIPQAFQDMQDRVPVTDLSYLIVAVQIQEESGGNMVESLSKLSNVIRARSRMFRKARALTAEGRISAWLLSLFPLLIGGGILLVKPDYYSQVSDYPLFTTLVVTTVVMLIINIAAMSIITNLKI